MRPPHDGGRLSQVRPRSRRIRNAGGIIVLAERIGPERRWAVSIWNCRTASCWVSSGPLSGAANATRNVRDFDDCGVEVIDTWQA